MVFLRIIKQKESGQNRNLRFFRFKRRVDYIIRATATTHHLPTQPDNKMSNPLPDCYQQFCRSDANTPALPASPPDGLLLGDVETEDPQNNAAATDADDVEATTATLNINITAPKTINFIIHLLFSFMFGFENVVIYADTHRFVTIMSGNYILLGIETSHWLTSEMMITLILILLFVFGGAAFDLGANCFKSERRLVHLFVVPAIIIMGVLADVIQALRGKGCRGNVWPLVEEDEPGFTTEVDRCAGEQLYFLAPIAFQSGLITSYVTYFPDGLTTHMMTAHMKILPKAIIAKENIKKGLTSASMISSYFLGCLAGAFAAKPVLTIGFSIPFGKDSKFWREAPIYLPIFTVLGILFGALCFLHFTLCKQFRDKYKQKQKLAAWAKAVLSQGSSTEAIQEAIISSMVDLVEVMSIHSPPSLPPPLTS